jgi:hypothetical protein
MMACYRTLTSQLGTGTSLWGIRLLEHSFSLPPDLIEVLIAAESERDLGIREQRSEHLLYALLTAKGESIHDRTPHYDGPSSTRRDVSFKTPTAHQ